MLINAVKDVTSALGDLMQATKSASGKNMQHPAMHTLKDAAKVGLSGLAGKPLKKVHFLGQMSYLLLTPLPLPLQKKPTSSRPESLPPKKFS